MRSTVASRSPASRPASATHRARVVPLRSAISLARCTVAPSASGSLNGTPSSSTSAPPSSAARASGMVAARSGKPTVRYTTIAACERRVLRSDARIVEPRRDRVGLADLAVLVLKDERARAVEHAHLSADDRRGVMPGLAALATRLDADELHRRVVDERAEDP